MNTKLNQECAPLSRLRLNLLRLMYLIIALGLAVTAWPSLWSAQNSPITADTVVNTMLVSFSLMALIGLKHPIKALPLLFIELFWKSIWLAVYGLPAYFQGVADQYVLDVTAACLLGVVITPLLMPWSYIYRAYAKG